MQWEFNSDRAIYAQIIEQMKLFIVSGELNPGDKVPSVRELASEAGVNPNTMQKALSELERGGLLFSNRTSGRFITEDGAMIQNIKEELAKENIENFLKNMEKIGFDKKQTAELILNFEKGVDFNE
ncbi:MAG: GntR family transcriptional regulator [Monoglobales bacterium]